MNISEYIASVRIDDTYVPLKCGTSMIGQLTFNLALEHKAEGLYSWVVHVENDSDRESPRIRELLGLDISLPVKDPVHFSTLRGDDNTIHSFYPESFDLTEGTVITRKPTGARSSNTTAFPYFDLVDASGTGIVCGIGWSGQWKLDVSRTNDKLRLAAGFQDCDFILAPHEKIRSIRVLIYFGQGDADALRHQFVRLHRKYYSPFPQLDNDTYFPVAATCFDRYYWGNIPAPGECNYFETEDAQIHIINSAALCRYINAYWMDACWFDGAFRTGVGNYRYADGFLNKLTGLSNLAHRKGMRFILWFEPARAMEGTDLNKLYRFSREKIISVPGDGRLVLANLGDPDIWQYQFDHISKIIEENGVDIYRQDFNIDPYDYLKSIETPDRVGISQIRFVEGMYRLWDALLERFPGLMIDNCASGGRLLDVETNMRAIPLWRSDMGCRPSPAAMQNEILGLSRYIPYHQGGAYDYSPYFLRSSMTTGTGCNFAFLSGIINPEAEERSMAVISSDERDQISDVPHIGQIDYVSAEKSLKDALRLREYWNGDFTALTPPSNHKAAIIAYTLRLPDEDRGVVLVFRRELAPDSFIIKLPNIPCHNKYVLYMSDEHLVETELFITGKQLTEGLPVTIGEAPGSLLITYRAIDPAG